MPKRFLAMTLCLLSSSALIADNWPQWRGPNNDGISKEKNIPGKFDEVTNVVWKKELPGPGASTPCIWEDKIFITCQLEDEVVLVCMSTAGKELWTKTIGKGTGSYRRDEGNMASASCSTDGKLVFATSGDGKMIAYTFDGDEKWSLDIQKTYGKFSIQFGTHWTPVLYKDHIYLQVLHRKAQVLVALEKNTGKEIWKVERESDGRGESPDVYASAFIWHKGDNALLISHGNDYCTAHKLSDGKEVWRVTELNPKAKYNRAWRAVASPLVTEDMIVVPSCKNGVVVAIDPAKASGTMKPGDSAKSDTPYDYPPRSDTIPPSNLPTSPQIYPPSVYDGSNYRSPVDPLFEPTLKIPSESRKEIIYPDTIPDREDIPSLIPESNSTSEPKLLDPVAPFDPEVK